MGDEWWIREALAGLGRSADPGEIARMLTAIETANGEGNRLDPPGIDTDPRLHRLVHMDVFRDAGLDAAMSDALYALDADPRFNVFACDTAATLQGLRQRGIAVAVISDIHFDLRPHFAKSGFQGLVDVFTLSFEKGVQKPDPLMFELTLTALGVEPSTALMVGDRSRPDGAAVEHGITTLLLPPLRDAHDARLHKVLALCDADI
jgi:FMN phosphatase YigB (HAD superfamily)